ncbi:MAG: class I SAM-dependent methyltransferase [Clostridiales bacterium]|nr:class I SAM-dependent methyltransferase [Clostridiales bacterium]
MTNRDYFNSVAENWDNIVNHDRVKIHEILTMTGVKEGDFVLDVGTGTGVLIPFLHERIKDTGRIVAVDVADKMIEVAKKKYGYPNVSYVVGDARHIDLEAGSFDLVICYSMFPHFGDKRDAVKKLSRYLKRGGRFVIAHSQSRQAINRLHRDAAKEVRNDRLPDAGILKGFYSDAGLETIHITDNEEMFVVVGQKR